MILVQNVTQNDTDNKMWQFVMVIRIIIYYLLLLLFVRMALNALPKKKKRVAIYPASPRQDFKKEKIKGPCIA